MSKLVKYVKLETAKLYKKPGSNEVLMELLWGDRVELQSEDLVNDRYMVNARWAKNAYVNATDLNETALLEFYFIDVGQGDGVLIVTPQREHILIDGGYTREKQPHGKSAADFVDWKFYKEYNHEFIALDAMICSHCDADHYGGLWDLLDKRRKDELDAKKTIIKNFYHSGVSWWKNSEHSRFLGRKGDNNSLIDLLSDRNSIVKGLKESEDMRLQGEWAQFLQCIVDTKAPVKRVSYNVKEPFRYLPGFEKNKEVSIKILGPIEENINGKPTLKNFGNNSQNTNGNSTILRIDYGKSRTLLTGDLNLKSQHYIIHSLSGNTQELAADVVKSCHHGSDDCSYEFMQYVQASATIISSGDDETHAHPRPNIVATAGATGFKKITNDMMITPLVYSTEISRSLRLGDPYEVNCVDYESNKGVVDVSLKDETKTKISYKHTTSGGLRGKNKTKPMDRLKVVDGIVYGLVNIRTDGNKILCATLNEGKNKWDIKTFYSRF